MFRLHRRNPLSKILRSRFRMISASSASHKVFPNDTSCQSECSEEAECSKVLDAFPLTTLKMLCQSHNQPEKARCQEMLVCLIGTVIQGENSTSQFLFGAIQNSTRSRISLWLKKVRDHSTGAAILSSNLETQQRMKMKMKMRKSQEK